MRGGSIGDATNSYTENGALGLWRSWENKGGLGNGEAVKGGGRLWFFLSVECPRLHLYNLGYRAGGQWGLKSARLKV